MTRRCTLAGLTLALSTAASAQQTPLQTPLPTPLPTGTSAEELHATAPSLRAVRAPSAVRVDGRLDEAAWLAAEPVTTFTQRDPEEGRPVSQPTAVRLLHDDEALYVGVRLADGAGVTNRLGRRDMPLLDSDWFAVTIDSHHDHRTAFRFQVNPGGVQRDATVVMGGGGESDDASWNPVWEVATTVDAGGWTAEIRIPFSQLRFQLSGGDTNAEQTWGIQMERVIGRRGEVAHFSFVPKRELAGVPRYGHLTGIASIGQGRRVELLPYVATRGEYVDPGSNPFRTDREHRVSLGADVLVRLTSNLTLNATVNPDFGQVDVDPAVVNLGVYEVFLPEQRPFFVEGSEIFDFTGNTSGGDLFYSRRIGRRPQLSPPSGRADVPDATTILGAAKLSGRTRGGWALGVLDAVTGREHARFLDAAGDAHAFGAEPLTNYFIARTRREMAGGRSAVGGAITSVVRDLDTPELRAALRSSAWTGGMDFRHEWSRRSWLLTGSVAASHVRGSEQAIVLTQRQSNHYFQRPDARHLGVDTTNALTGYSVGFNLTKQAGEHWTGSLAGALTSPRYEANDLGFATRTDRRDVQSVLTYAENQPGRVLRDWSISAVARDEHNFGGDRVQTFLQLRGQARHLSFWSASAALVHRLRATDDRSTRGGPLLVRPGETSLSIGLSSDPRRPVTASVDGAVQRTEFGGDGLDIGGSVSVRTSPWWNLTLGPSFSRGRIAAQYLATVPDPAAGATYGRRYLFAPLDFTELNADIRLNVTFAPRLTLEVYGQPLIFSSGYGEAGALAAPRTFIFEPYAGELPAFDNTLRSLRGNAVLRWEWRPGSTLYLAWQQTRRGLGREREFDVGRDPRLLFEAPPDNIVVLKATYWFSP